MTDPAAIHAAVLDEIDDVLVGNRDVVEGLSIALLTGGHVLLEGVPGSGKTTIANLFARASGLEYTRVQMTPDVLPADITGTNVYREATGEFELRLGPVFSNVVLADEINRATPKTQSALLEPMEENTATIDGETLPLPEPFILVATQNPIEMEGTYELPEAQRDRFLFKLTVALLEGEEELDVLRRAHENPNFGVGQVSETVSPHDILAARDVVADVYVDESVMRYIQDIVAATRMRPEVVHGGSTRASLSFLWTAKARAAIDGRTYVIPDDVKAFADAILAHRLILNSEAELSERTASDVVRDVLDTVAPPGFDDVTGDAVEADEGSSAD